MKTKLLKTIILISSGLITAVSMICFLHPVLNGGLTSHTTDWIFDVERVDENTNFYYKPQFEKKEDAYKASKELALDIQTEGSTLLKNNDKALPLKDSERKISVFGTGSVNIAYGGTGSGAGNRAQLIDLYSALQEEGFEYNPILHDFYQQKKKEGYVRGQGTDMNGAYLGTKGNRDYGYSINEVEKEAYNEVRDSYENYSDVALVVFSRSGGEGQDLPTSMEDFYEGNDSHYLELTKEEKELLLEVKEGPFKKVVVLLNVLNPFECDFLFDTNYRIDACINIGGPGAYGLQAVAQILHGKRNISGRLSDIYAKDLLSSPAMQNYGDNHFLDKGVETSATYVSYNENMYIGYRYYETIYEDQQLKRHNAADFVYEENVVFPFGYGLSYSSFEWSNPTLSNDGDNYNLTLNVTNTSEFDGKDVVQVYLQKPYTSYDIEKKIEKPAVTLVTYTKTPLIKAGETIEVSLSFENENLASYDTYGEKTYLIEKGDYYITLAHDSHEAIQSILKEKGLPFETKAYCYKETISSTTLYDESKKTGYPITNRFETDSYSSLPKDIQMLSRHDWKNTYPKMYGDSGIPGKAKKEFNKGVKESILNQDEHAHLGKNDDTYDYLYNTNTKQIEKILIKEPITNSDENINFSDLIDEQGKPIDYYDPKWDRLVQKLSVDELYHYLSFGMGRNEALPQINKRLTLTSDSPMGLRVGTLFPSYPIQAGTFSNDIAKRMGEQIAEEALHNDIRGWYSPTCNIHRHPFGGRNYEYYSEDPILAGIYVYHVVSNVQEHGTFVQVKHFALNDQDTNRGDRGNFKNDDPYNGLITYANEQSIREIYLKVFEFAIEKANGHGVMTSYNRIGHTWSGGHYGLVTEILRNEWGLQGNALTDYAGTFGYRYMNMNQGLRAGNDVWLHPSKSFPIQDRKSNAAIYYMQKAAKHMLFTEACSSRVNNQKKLDGTSVIVFYPVHTWQILMVSIVVIIALFDFIFFIVLHRKQRG